MKRALLSLLLVAGCIAAASIANLAIRRADAGPTYYLLAVTEQGGRKALVDLEGGYRDLRYLPGDIVAAPTLVDGQRMVLGRLCLVRASLRSDHA